MTTLVEYMIVADVENRLPMLDKSMYNSWESRMFLYIKEKKNGRMMLESIENGPLVYPAVEEDAVKQGLLSVITIRVKGIWQGNALSLRDQGTQHDHGIANYHDIQPTIIHNAAFQTNDLDSYDSEYDDISSTKAVLMANLSSYSSNILSENLLGYALTKKVYIIHNKRTRLIIETIHDTFDELTAMASEQFSSGPRPQLLTPGTLSSGLVPDRSSPTPVASSVPVVVAPDPADLTGLSSSTSIDKDAPSPSTSQTPQET
nr:hypothetical protein [Tanacetum cinerariifolium]